MREVYEASNWDWRFGSDQYPQTRITLTDSHPPFWGEGVAAASSEIAFPFLDDYGATLGVAYYPSGDIYIDSRISDPWLREVAMHEAAHSRVMFRWFFERDAGQSYFRCRPLMAWQELLCPQLTQSEYDSLRSQWYWSDIEAHAEHFRVAYYPAEWQQNPIPRTNFNVLPVEAVRAFHDEWAPREPALPWPDINPDDDELMAAAWWAKDAGIFEGYDDGIFWPFGVVLKRHVALVAQRVGIPGPDWESDYGIATRWQVYLAIPGLTWNDRRWEEPLLRSQLLRLMYRARDGLDPDAEIAARLEQWFVETRVTWQGVTRQPRLIGHAALLVQLSREYRVPLWLALGQCWRESQWFTTGLATRYNCGWGIKGTNWGALGTPPTVSGFANYATVEESIRAYFRLMDSPLYRSLIDAQNWRGVLDRYAPPYENNSTEHWAIVRTVRGWCEERGIW